MPIFDFQGPDGKTHSIEGPEGSTPEQAFAALQQRFAQAEAPSVGSQIKAGLSGVAQSAIGGIKDYLNPFSEARHASYAKQAQLPLGEGLVENLKQVAGTGAVLHNVVDPMLGYPGQAAGAVITPPAGALWQYGNKLAGIDLPTDVANEQAGTALSAMRPSAATPAGVGTIKAPPPKTEDLHAAYLNVRRDPDVINKQVPVQDVANLAARMENELVKPGGYRESNAQGTLDVIRGLAPQPKPLPYWERVQAEMNGLPTVAEPPVKSVSMDDLLNARAALNKEAAQTQDFKATPNASAAMEAKPILDDFIEQYAPKMREANLNEAAYQMAKNFDFRGRKAEFKTNDSNSGMNLENNLRKQVTQILTNPKERRRYSSEQIDALEAFNRGSRSANVIRMVGNIFGGGGGWMTVANSFIGSMLGGPVGAIVEPAAGIGLKALGNRRALKQFNSLADMMRETSPFARSLPPVAAPLPGPLMGLLGSPMQLLNALGLRPLPVLPTAADE